MDSTNSVQVSDGLFNVMLGSLTQIPQVVITGNNNLFLGITVGTDSEMSPRVQLGSVPFATQALTVPDGSITKAKLAGDVNLVPADGSITTAKLASGAATGYWFAKGTTDISTNLTSMTTISEMSLEISTLGGLVDIHFDSGVSVLGDPNVGWIDYAIYVDGGQKNLHAQRLSRVSDSSYAQISWAEVLSAGTHTVQIKWKVSSTSMTARINSTSNTWEQRILVVREYRR